MSRNIQAHEVPVSRVFGKVKVASRGAWLAGLGAIARVQRRAPTVYATLVREGAQFEGRAVKSARRVVDAVKASRGYEAVERTGRDYAKRLRSAYVTRVNAVTPDVAPAKRTVKRKATARTTARRVKRAA
jgi:poly(hydroxyalkanoate) granule-associated protein